tara:strand:+ start:74 stop:487 length:414 start_codon:yes stop_codon:yes gene_type:complete
MYVDTTFINIVLICGIVKRVFAQSVIKSLDKIILYYNKMNITIAIITSMIIIIAAIFLDDGEKFTGYSSKHNKTMYKPRTKLPPGYTDINYTHKNSKTGIPILNKTNYCEENPSCYPCPNWTDMGNPKCAPYTHEDE